MAGDAELEGVYRFLNNASVGFQQMIAPHLVATANRCTKADFVVAHDTTVFCFNGRAGLEDLGRLSHPGSQVFLDTLHLRLIQRRKVRRLVYSMFSRFFANDRRAGETGRREQWRTNRIDGGKLSNTSQSSSARKIASLFTYSIARPIRLKSCMSLRVGDIVLLFAQGTYQGVFNRT